MQNIVIKPSNTLYWYRLPNNPQHSSYIWAACQCPVPKPRREREMGEGRESNSARRERCKMGEGLLAARCPAGCSNQMPPLLSLTRVSAGLASSTQAHSRVSNRPSGDKAQPIRWPLLPACPLPQNRSLSSIKPLFKLLLVLVEKETKKLLLVRLSGQFSHPFCYSAQPWRHHRCCFLYISVLHTKTATSLLLLLSLSSSCFLRYIYWLSVLPFLQTRKWELSSI